ncbi:aldo/keto reductase, partial [Anaerostipes butyraticus]|uniref:aldo/keto reductase n=1 Tax=Anaerostipes butyraticus TaxID=645466 RepID=UPI0023A8F522
MEQVLLNNGVKMPVEGFGVFQISDEAQCWQCVLDALETGYRLFDTAAAYHNEQAVGRAVRGSGIPRDEIFITTKLWVQDAGYDQTLAAFERSRKNLGLDYIDLYLIHQPFGDYYGAWRAMEKLYREGIVKAIGVSNFSPEWIVDLCMNHEIKPAVNQIEIHPFYQQEEALRVMRSYDIVPEAWGPFWDFELTQKDMKEIEAMDIRHSEII